MELLLKIPLEDFEIKEFPDTGTILLVRKGFEGESDYTLEGEGFVLEFKEGKPVYLDIYDPEVAKAFKKHFALELKEV
jgi:hypothetical protein